MKSLKERLDELYEKYSREEYLFSDPVEFPGRYANRNDKEISGYIAAMFAYGNVKAMKGFLENVFRVLGESPCGRISAGPVPAYNLYYRFQSERDIDTFFHALSELLKLRSAESNAFSGGIFNLLPEGRGSDLKSRIDRIRETMLEIVPASRRTRGYRHLIGAGSDESARKRYCMFFRWMTRRTFPDFSLYRDIQPSELVIPLDTHIMRVAEILGLRSRATQNWKTALEITENLKRISPEDPLRYDFSLTRPGILGEIFPD